MQHRESSLVLNPPSRPVQPNLNEPKKTPSLFERITGRHSKDEVQDTKDDTTSYSSTGNAGSIPSGLVAERKTVATNYDTPISTGEQGSLNIDAPSAPMKTVTSTNKASEDLDIPAFLRRQIS